MELVYLASPYSPIGVSDQGMASIIREDRFRAACRAAAYLMRQGKVVFAPIAHSHYIDAFFSAPESGEFWKRQDEPYLTLLCTEMVVLMLPGWEQSSGVRHEIEVAQFRGIPITYLEPL
jgi:hypothetical protein